MKSGKCRTCMKAFLIFAILVIFVVLFYSKDFFVKEKIVFEKEFSWDDAYGINSEIPLINDFNYLCAGKICRRITVGSDRSIKKSSDFCQIYDFYEFDNLYEKEGVFFKITAQISRDDYCCVFCAEDSCSRISCDPEDPEFVLALFYAVG